MAAALQKFVQLTKIDARLRQVWGVMAAEERDHSDEVFDYATSKPLFEAWSAQFEKATGGKSRGNVRAMHQPIAAGKVIALEFDDAGKLMRIGTEIIDDAEWAKCEAGVYTGFSIGGAYEKRWADPGAPGLIRYTARPAEVSLVDNPCIPGATFTAIKADGSTELRKFATGELAKAEMPGEEEAAPAAESGAESPQIADAVADAAVEAVENLLDMEAEEETVEDATEEDADDPTVEVSLGIIATLHAQVVALGARCDATSPWRQQEAVVQAALGNDPLPAPMPSNPLDYVLGQMHDTLVALGAECTGAAKAAIPADLTKAGAALSAANMARLRAIHDQVAAMGACPAPADADAAEADTDSEDEAAAMKATPALAVGSLAPAPEVVALHTQLETLQAELAKAVAAAGAFEAQRTALEARIAALESAPATAGPALTAEALAARPVEKSLPGATPAAAPLTGRAAEIAALEAIVYDSTRNPIERQEAGRELADLRRRGY